VHARLSAAAARRLLSVLVDPLHLPLKLILIIYKWHTMSGNEKAPYIALARADRARCDAENESRDAEAAKQQAERREKWLNVQTEGKRERKVSLNMMSYLYLVLLVLTHASVSGQRYKSTHASLQLSPAHAPRAKAVDIAGAATEEECAAAGVISAPRVRRGDDELTERELADRTARREERRLVVEVGGQRERLGHIFMTIFCSYFGILLVYLAYLTAGL
jgi:hypothetical protein